MKKTILFLFILSLLAISAYASGCGLSCSAASRATATSDYTIPLPENITLGAGIMQSNTVSSYCGAGMGQSPYTCVTNESLTSCIGSSGTCDSLTTELNSFNYSRTGSKFNRTDAKERGNYVVTTGLYNISSSINNAIVVVTDKNGNEICKAGIKNNLSLTPLGFHQAYIASVRPNAGDVFIVTTGGNLFGRPYQIFVIVLNLTNCNIINATGVYGASQPIYGITDAEDDSTPSTEGNNMLITGWVFHASKGIQPMAVGFNSTLNFSSAPRMDNYNGATDAYFKSVAYDLTTNRFVAIGYGYTGTNGNSFISRIIPGPTTISSFEANVTYTLYYGGSPNNLFFAFDKLTTSNGKTLISGFRRNLTNTTYPVFLQFDIATLNPSSGYPERNRTTTVSTAGNLSPPAPINTSTGIWLTFLDNTTSEAVVYNLNSTWNVTNTGALSNTQPEDIREGTNGIYVLGNDLLGTNAIYAGISPSLSTFFTEVLISNLRVTGRDPLRDPSDVFIIGGEDTTDLFIEVLNSNGPTPQQVPEFTITTLIISLLAGLLIIATIRKKI